MASKKTTVNKSAWIRSQPTDVPAKDLVAQAKKEGITITDGQVYTTRSEMKKKGSEEKAGTAKKVAHVEAPSGGSIEALIRSIVRDEVKRFFADR